MKAIIAGTKEKALIKNEWLIEKKDNLFLLFSPLLRRYPSLIHAFTTRQGGKSKPPFDSFNIGINQTVDEEARADARHNRALLCQSLGLPFQNLITAKRLVHSADVVMLETDDEPGEVDGIATKIRLRPIYMTFADCVPIIIYDTSKQIICLVHAGWKGTASSIGQKAVKFMIDKCGSQTVDLVSAIGPAINLCCYPIGLNVVLKLMSTLTDNDELVNMISEMDNPLDNGKIRQDMTDKVWRLIEKLALDGFFIRRQQIHVDLKAINAYQLLALDVSQVDVINLCTSCEKDLFYSYRRSYVEKEGATGRQAAIACLV
jgi:YfiH family protein